MKLVYCYDAYCGWCYGFSPVIRRFFEEYRNRLDFEVISGGMILPESPRHISVTAAYIRQAYPRVEELTGVKFGPDYLWHINNPDESDWYPDSMMPAVALCIFREYYPKDEVLFAADLQYALHFEGRDLCDKEAYRHLVEKYALPEEEFFAKLQSEEYKEKAMYDFTLTKQLQVSGFPAVYIQVDELKFYQIARGYTDYDTLKKNAEAVLNSQPTTK